VIELVDIGVNLTNKSLRQDLDAVLKRSLDAGIIQMVVTGTSIGESRNAIGLCQDCVRAIGETGLDFNRNFSPAQAQQDAFEQQMVLAIELQLPLFCHQRDAHQRFVEMLREHRNQLGRVVVHCFTDTREALLDYLDLDCHIGITGWICDERRGLELRELVKLIPADRILLETDAPYLLPRNLDPKPASRINEPAFLRHILEEVAICRSVEAAQLARETLNNSRTFFGL